MPGFDVNRFVDLPEDQMNEYMCSICHDILRSPFVTNCCQQLFCKDCINGWLRTNNTCPYDRIRLTNRQLSRPPRAFMNLMGKLRIRCEFRDNGCNEVIALENLRNHVQQCQYNYDIKECAKCLCNDRKANHDCVQYLLDSNNKLSIEVYELKISYKESLDMNETINNELNQLKRSNEEVLKTLDACRRESNSNVNMLEQINNRLKNENEKLKKNYKESLEMNRNFINELKHLKSVHKFGTSSTNGWNVDLLLQQTKSINVPTLVPNNISCFTDSKVEETSLNMWTEFRDDVVNTARQALHKYDIEKKSEELVDYIKSEFDRKYGPNWRCIIGCNINIWLNDVKS